MSWANAALAVAGMLCAGGAGYAAWGVCEVQLRRARHKRSVREGAVGAAEAAAGGSRQAAGRASRSLPLDERVVAYLEGESRALSLGHGVRLVPARLVRAAWLESHAAVAGVAETVSAEGFCEARVRLAFLTAACGALAGAVLSAPLTALGAVAGLVGGWRLPVWALARRIERRAQDMEQRLPEMLDVVALGMRSGMSFDRSLALYAQHFDTLLARSFALAQRQWMCGFERRDDALRRMAASYDSPLFERAVEGMVRSLRFGSSMVEGLEAAAAEARAGYRARRQEQVAKAPVKMMVPTGALILPAMLILVLGPVLLELTGGFS